MVDDMKKLPFPFLTTSDETETLRLRAMAVTVLVESGTASMPESLSLVGGLQYRVA